MGIRHLDSGMFVKGFCFFFFYLMLNLSIHNNLLDLLNLTSGQILNVA